MSWVVALLLGVLQGLTEFLPVSSSGHLALAQMLIPGFSQPGLFFDLALHGGTLISVLALEWDRLREAWRQGYVGRLGLLLVLGTGATALLAFPLRRWAEEAFHRPGWIGVGFLLTREGEGLPSPWQAVLVGLVQGVAVFPGLSRSGSTVAAALLSGMNRRWAADFSFLLSLPAIGGALLVEGVQQRAALAREGAAFWGVAFLGALAAAASGLLALRLVRRLVHQGRLAIFALYLVPLGLLVLVGLALGWWP
jgi:undecaprenyl-diphosphatase